MRFLTSLPLAAVWILACSSSTPDDTPTTTTTTTEPTTTSGTAGAGGSVSPPPTGPITGLVKRYDYAFDLTTAHARASLDVDVAPPGGDCFTVSDGAAATGEVRWNDAVASKGEVASGLLTACGTGVTAGSPLVLAADVDVATKTFLGLDVGFSRTKDKDGGEFTYLLSWVGGCDHFGPCDSDPSRLAAFHFEITHPPGTVALCPGVLTPGETLTTCDLSATLAPTYSAFALAADPLWKRTPFTSAAGVDIVFYETPTGNLAKSLDKASVAEFMVWITDLLGPFPYGNELRVAGAPTRWLGFEHPANIILDESAPTLVGAYEDATMHTLMHETVHQWAGDRSTIATTLDFVWKEATAEYLTYVFEDEHRPPVEAAASLEYWDAVSVLSDHFPRPTDDPALAVKDFYGDVYGPGPMVLYVQLESMFGRKVVLDGVKAFLAEPGARTVADLRDALSASSGQDLTAYFDAWVFGKGKPEWPTFAVATKQTGSQVDLTLTQQNASGKLYGCVVEVEVQGATQKTSVAVDFGASPKSATSSVSLTFAEPVTATVLDPRHRLVSRVAAGPTPLIPPPKRKVFIL